MYDVVQASRGIHIYLSGLLLLGLRIEKSHNVVSHFLNETVFLVKKEEMKPLLPYQVRHFPTNICSLVVLITLAEIYLRIYENRTLTLM